MMYLWACTVHWCNSSSWIVAIVWAERKESFFDMSLGQLGHHGWPWLSSQAALTVSPPQRARRNMASRSVLAGLEV